MKEARARVPTIRGPVDVRFENKPGSSFLLEVTIPANVTARVGVPALGDPTPFVTLDGKRLKGIPEDGFVFLDSVGSGRHTLARTGGRATAGK